MAITIVCDQAAEAICCFERPSYIGGTRSSQPHIMSDFGDLHEQVIIGTHPDGYIVGTGDYLRFEIYPEVSAAATFRTGVDLKFIAGPYLSDGPTLDEAGLAAAIGDRAPRMSQWTQVAISLEPFVGLTLDQFIVHFEDDTAGAYILRLRQVLIQNGNDVVKEFWVGASSGLLAEIPGIYLSNPESSLVNLLIDTDVVYGDVITVSTGTSYSVSADSIVVINTSTTGNMTFNLPDAGLLPNGKFYVFKNNHASNTLTIDPFSSQTIDGATTKVLTTQYQVLEIVRVSSTTWAQVG